jgi:signal transduction histidine kinase
MKKVALVFVVAVLVPSLVLAWLAVRSLRDQQFLLERQQSLLYQHVTDTLATKVSDHLAWQQQQFGVMAEMLAGKNPREATLQFDNQLRKSWPLADVGFCVTLSGVATCTLTSPSPASGPEAQRFLADNGGFLGNRESAEVYWNANTKNVGQNVSGAMTTAEAGKSISGTLKLAPHYDVNSAPQQLKLSASLTNQPTANNDVQAQNIYNAKTQQRAVTPQSQNYQVTANQSLQQGNIGNAKINSGNNNTRVNTSQSPSFNSNSIVQSAQQLPERQSQKVEPDNQIINQSPDQQDANLSKVVPAEAEFRQLIGDETDGMLARFLQNKLKLMFWHRLNNDPNLIFGAQLNLNRVIDGLREIVQADPELRDEIAVALLDDNAKPMTISRASFQSNWKHPFVATEVGEALPHWEVAAYLINPAQLTQAAHVARLTLGLLIATLVLAIGVGSWLIVTNLGAELKLARQKTDFVSNVSHELKTPLTSIRMFSELLAEGRVTEPAKQKSYLQIITAEAARLTRLINNVLDFSRMESGEKKYNFQPCDLAEVARNAAQTFRPHLEASGFKFDCTLPDAAIPVRGDGDALSQIIVNLLSNAEKYSNGISTPSPRPSGERAGVRGTDIETRDLLTPTLSSFWGGEGENQPNVRKEISMQVNRKETPLPYVEIKVLDRGTGVPRDCAEKIFEKFYRAHDSLSSSIQGSGLGLTIARQIARAHGGDVVYEPREGGGSCFSLRLPLTKT